MAEEMDMSNPADEEEQERKLLEESSNDEDMGSDEKIDVEEILEGESGNESGKIKDTADNDSTDDDDEEAAKAEIQKLEEILGRNPYDYDSHLRLIGILHKMGELEQLRVARENMSSQYPLAPEIWLSWIRDESKVAVTQEQKIAVTKLCERATEDYLSVEVWLEYLQLSMGLGHEKETIDKIRVLFERALTAAGLHVVKGSLIWDVFREFENIRALLMEPEDAEQTYQINRTGKLYRRQLACPLIGMEKTYEEYEMWRSTEGSKCTEDETVIKSVYKKGLQQLALRKPFEEKLENALNKTEQLDAYKAYLIKEKEIGDPGRVTVLYERAIADISLEPTLWIDYTNYVKNHLRIDAITEKLYNRAFRNVPWSVQLWKNWIRFSEKQNKSLTEMQKLFENALEACDPSPEQLRDLWMTYLEYLRRRIDDDDANEKKQQIDTFRSACREACANLSSFGLEGDRNCEILQFLARIEAIYGNSMQNARKVWADIMSQGHSEFATSWLEYISLERSYGDTKHLRKLYLKALTAVKDWPESIGNAWINFERDEGNVDQVEISEMKTQEKLQKVAEERKKLQDRTSFTKKASNKRKADDGKWKNLDAESKISKIDQPKSPQNTNPFAVITKISAKHKVFPPSNEEIRRRSHMFKRVAPQRLVSPTYDDNSTIFVSNLDYDTTEEEVKEAIASVGSIISFTMIKDYKGRSKGYGYIQLSSPQAVEAALRLDRIRIKGRPMFISRCDTDRTSHKPVFKYKTELEKNKVFIKGLSLNTTKEQLNEKFKVYGNIEDIRIVTYRNGHSKGLAYIDFEEEQSASKAVLEMDGKKIDDKEISVAISQPPQRKRKISEDESQLAKSLGGTSISRSNFGNPKTVLSLIPRTVRQNTNTKAESASGNGVAQPMSNADFRNMLLNKK